MPFRLDNPQHWRERAEEARILAEDMKQPEAKRQMLEIAESYDRIAARTEQSKAMREPKADGPQARDPQAWVRRRVARRTRRYQLHFSVMPMSPGTPPLKSTTWNLIL